MHCLSAIGRASSLRCLREDVRPWLLLLWWAPCVAYYALGHIVHVMHVLTLMPALMVYAGAGLVMIAQDWPTPACSAGLPRRILLALAALSALYSLFACVAVSRPQILFQQRQTDDIVGFIHEHFRPESSFIAQAGARRQLKAVLYRLPGFEGVQLEQTLGQQCRPSLSVPSPIKLPPEVEYLIIPEPMAKVYVPTEQWASGSDVAVRWRRLAPDERYVFFDERGVWTGSDSSDTEPPIPAPLASVDADGP